MVMRRLKKRKPLGERGLTLLELSVVAAILAILAALAAAGVVGQASNSRSAAKDSDSAEVQKGVDSYRSTHPSSEFPVLGGTLSSTGNLGIVFRSSFTDADGNAKKLVPDYLARNPKDALDCAKSGAVVGSDSISSSTSDPDGDCNAAVTGSEPVWQLDKDGAVVVNLDDGSY